MCNIYRIYLDRKTGYDQFRDAVVIAFSERDARETYPHPNLTIPSIQHQRSNRDKNSSRMLHYPLDIKRDGVDEGPWVVEYKYSLAHGFHKLFNGVLLEQEQKLFRDYQDDEWTSEPDNVRTEMIGIVPQDMDYSPRVIMSDFRAG